MSDCGCEIRFGTHKLGTSALVVHCPLHKAAGQMREALKETAGVLHVRTHTKLFSFWECEDLTCQRARAALAAANEAK